MVTAAHSLVAVNNNPFTAYATLEAAQTAGVEKILLFDYTPAGDIAVSTDTALIGGGVSGIGGTITVTNDAALTLAGALRELLGTGKIFGAQLMPEGFGMTIFIQPPGAFLVFALIIAVMNAIGIKTRQRKLVESGCDGNCSLCQAVCETREAGPAAKAEEKGGADA